MEHHALLPSHFVLPSKRYNDATEEAVMHKTLLELSESLLIYIVGIMLGEYKSSKQVSLKLETEFYKFSRQKPSFGHFLSIFRMLNNEMPNSIFNTKFEKQNIYEKTALLIYQFGLLKEVIDDGADENFQERIAQIKGRTMSSNKGLLDLFDIIINIRNIFAHPEDKAGKKEQKRKWPLGDEYFKEINGFVYNAVMEVVEDIDVFVNYKPVFAKNIDDKSRKGTFLLETGEKSKEFELDLTVEDLSNLSTEFRYLLDSKDQVYVQIYYHTIPSVNPLVAKQIIDIERAKVIEPHLREIIKEKLADDGKIDNMEFLVMQDTAKTAAISIEKLFSIIEEEKNKLGLLGSVGSPDMPGDIFIDDKIGNYPIVFNPWWLHYFSMVPNIDKTVIAKQKSDEKEYKSKIELLTENVKLIVNNPKIQAEQKALKQLLLKKKELENGFKKIFDEHFKALTKSDGLEKENIEKKIKALKEEVEKKLPPIVTKIQETESKINALEDSQSEKLTEATNKLITVQNNYESFAKYTQWGIHKNIWKELDQYVDVLLAKNLNKSFQGEEDLSEPNWINTTNAWQIGALSYTYWARIHPGKAPLENIFHIGYAIANPFKWVPKNIHPSLKPILNKSVSVMWTSVDDKRLEKIDIDNVLILKRREFNKELIIKYEKELIDLGANVKLIPIEHIDDPNDQVEHFMPFESYLEERDKYIIGQIYSRLWTVEMFYENGQLNIDAVERYEKEMLTLLQLFSNVIERLNDYALTMGINEEVIKQREDQVTRWEKIIIEKIRQKYPVGTDFKPTREELNEWMLFSENDLGMSKYLFDYIIGKFRFHNRTKKENE
jgi:hypothetical protein